MKEQYSHRNRKQMDAGWPVSSPNEILEQRPEQQRSNSQKSPQQGCPQLQSEFVFLVENKLIAFEKQSDA